MNINQGIALNWVIGIELKRKLCSFPHPTDMVIFVGFPAPHITVISTHPLSALLFFSSFSYTACFQAGEPIDQSEPRAVLSVVPS